MISRISFGFFLIAYFFSCKPDAKKENEPSIQYAKGTYAYDVDFLKAREPGIIELKDESGTTRILLSAAYQGRVMTSTAMGDSGNSYGWINYQLIGTGKWQNQFNPVGGEERFWLGPEGGQYSLYFRSGDSMNINHWQVPAIIDTMAYEVVQSDNSSATFSRKASLVNYSGFPFQFEINRKVTLASKTLLEEKIQSGIPGDVRFVGYESVNEIKNTGDTAWTRQKGLLSIWLLGMFTPSDQTVAIIPFHPMPNYSSHITDNYFGKVPPDRLIIRDSVLFFKCDGKYRSKIGLSPQVSKPLAASFDFNKNILTVIFFDIDKGGLYVNSKWEMQQYPYKGDVLNSYNDGPLETGSQLGPFYELESSSAAKELKPGEKQIYKQVTCHFEGSYDSMKTLARQMLAINLDEVKQLAIGNK